MAPGSISNYLSALWAHHRLLGFPSHGHDIRLQHNMRGIRRLGSSSRVTRHLLALEELRSMFGEINTLFPLDLAFWSATSLAFSKSHYTYSPHNLRWRDVSIWADHVRIRIASSKTDQFSVRGHRVLLNSSPGSFICPVFWLSELVRVHSPLESDFVIRVPGPRGVAPMNYQWFNLTLKLLASRIGLDPTAVSSHSLRHGGASHMAAQGVNLIDIRARGGGHRRRCSAIFTTLTPPY